MRDELARIARALRSLASRGVVRAVRTGFIRVEVLKDDVHEVEHMLPYGFAHRPRAVGTDAIVISLGAVRGRSVAILVSDNSTTQTDLDEGEVCIHDDQDQRVLIARDHVGIEANDVRLANGTQKAVARVDDTVTATAATDPALFTWLTAVSTALALSPPTSITGKVATGSGKVTSA